jgi:hypothetical protein
MLPYLLVAVIACGWAAFAVWIVRKYWRRSDDPVQARRYAYAKVFAVSGGILSAICGAESLELPGVSPVFVGLPMLVFGFPICLCTGYWSAVLIDALSDSARPRR